MSMYDKLSPYEVKVPAGESVYICQCGHTGTPPFCDGTHVNHPGKEPFAYKAEKDASIWVCGCGRTANPPFCDGSHNQ